MNEPTLNESQDLFRKITEAMGDADPSKLDALMKVEQPVTPAPEPEPVPQEPVASDVQEVVATPAAPAADASTPPDTQAPEPVVEDPFAAIPDTLKPFVDKLRQEAEANAQKAKHFERLSRNHGGRMGQLQQELERLKQASKTSEPKPQLPAALNIDTVEGFKELIETDPAFAKVYKASLEKVTSELEDRYLSKFKDFETHYQQVREKEVLEKETDMLLHFEPNAREIISMPEWQEFKDRALPNLRNMANSTNHQEVLFAFEQFGNYLRAEYPDRFAATPPPQAAPAATPTPAANAATIDRVAEQRQRQLQHSAAVPPARLNAPPVVESSPAELFARFYEEIGKELTGK